MCASLDDLFLMPFFGHSCSQVLTLPPSFPIFLFITSWFLSPVLRLRVRPFVFHLKSIWWVRKPVAWRGAEGSAGSGFRLVQDAVRDDYNDYDDYECLAVSASLLPTDRIDLTFWRRHFILTITVSRLFFTTLNAVSKQQEKKDGLYPEVQRASESYTFSHWCWSS